MNFGGGAFGMGINQDPGLGRHGTKIDANLNNLNNHIG